MLKNLLNLLLKPLLNSLALLLSYFKGKHDEKKQQELEAFKRELNHVKQAEKVTAIIHNLTDDDLRERVYDSDDITSRHM